LHFSLIDYCLYTVKVMLVVLYAVTGVKQKVVTMHGMFFMCYCFWVVLSCLIFVQKNPENLKNFLKT